MGLAETAKMAVRIDLEGNALSGISRLNSSIGGLGKNAGKVGKGVGQIGGGLLRAGAIAAGAAAGGLLAAAKAGADFEAQINTINTIAQQTPDKLQGIGAGIRKTARDNGLALDDLTTAYYDLLSAGIKVGDAQGVLNQAVRLSVGTLGTTSQAVDVLTTALNAYQLKGSDAARVSEELAVAVRDGKVTLDQIAPSYANVAAIAAQAGIGTDEIAAAYGRLTAQGVPAAEVTTQMSRAILELIKPNKALRAVMEKTGINFAKLAKDKGLVFALETLRKKAKELKVPFVDLFGRVEGYKFALQTTGPKNAAFVAEFDAIHKATGVLSAQVGERQQGLAFQFGRLKAFVLDAGLTLSSGFLPALTRTADKLSKFLAQTENQDAIKSIGEDIGKAIDGIDWAEVLRGAKDFVSVLRGALGIAKTIWYGFNALPGQVKASVAALLVLNKASGGLVGAGVSNIVGGLAGAAATGLGSRLPGVGALFAQPVFVTNFPAGFGAGVPGGGIGNAIGAGAGISGAAALGIGGLAVGGALLAAVNSPLWVKNTTLNTKNENAGLTQAERAAQTYYTASAADQAQMRKHLAFLPTKADFDSGNAKLTRAINSSGSPDDRNRPAPKTGGKSIEVRDEEAVKIAAAVERSRESIRSAVTQGTATQQNATEAVKTQVSSAQVANAVSVAAGALLQYSATNSASGAIVAAIHAIPPPQLTVNVSPTTINNRYGKDRASRDGDGGGGPGQG